MIIVGRQAVVPVSGSRVGHSRPALGVGNLELDAVIAVDLQINKAWQQIPVRKRDISRLRPGTNAADQPVSYFNKPHGGNVVGRILTRQDVRGANKHLSGGVTGWRG